MAFIFISFLLFLSIFIYLLRREPRTLFIGFYFILTIGNIILLLIFSAENKNLLFTEKGNSLLFTIIALSISFVILFLPILVVFTLIFKGIKLIKREGLALRNILSVTLGIFLLLFPMLSGIYIRNFHNNIYLMTLYKIGMVVFVYTFSLIILYTISSIINLIHIRSGRLDYIVVLGCGLIGDKVSPLLASRINKGIKIYKKNGNSKIIMSGGKGSDELIAEAEAMRNYALLKGVDKDDIIIENKSRNTKENILFSKNLMRDNSKFAIVTNYYHIFRALLIAKDLNIKCIGYGSKTKLYFALNAFIREIIGYFYLKKKLHGIIMGSISSIIIIYEIFVNII